MKEEIALIEFAEEHKPIIANTLFQKKQRNKPVRPRKNHLYCQQKIKKLNN